MKAGHGVANPELGAQEGHHWPDRGLEKGEEAEEEVGRPGALVTTKGEGVNW